MQPEFPESDRNHLSCRSGGKSATVATSVHVVAQARGLKGPTNDLVQRCAPHHTAVVVQNHMGKPYACLVLGESHSDDLRLAFDCVEAFVSIRFRWRHELAVSVKNLGNGSSVVALDESCERHSAILPSPPGAALPMPAEKRFVMRPLRAVGPGAEATCGTPRSTAAFGRHP